MSTTYKVVAGDTFGLIARKQYGTEIQASRIIRANPGIAEPLTPGTSITIPTIPTAPKDLKTATAASNEDEVALLIDGERFRFWEAVRIRRSLDSLSTISFSAPFEPDNIEFRNIFRPFSFRDVDITVGGIPLFAGTMLTPAPQLTSKKRTVSVDAYSLPGVLDDCPPPASTYPIEFDEQGLKEIAVSLCLPFGIGVKFLVDQGPAFEQVADETGKEVLSFLADLAKQRNIVISDTPAGELLFWQSVEPGKPVAILSEGSSPVLSVIPRFNPQGYYSEITGLDSVEVGFDGSQYTVKNPHLKGVLRPKVFTPKDTEDGTIKAAVEAKIGRMFGNMVSYDVFISTGRDPQGDLWTPNTTIKLTAPGAMIYNEFEFVIRNVELIAEKDKRTAVLNVVIPGSFSGKIPEALPWDE